MVLHYRRDSWRPVQRGDDALLDLGPHLIDLALFLTRSAPLAVRAHATRDRAGIVLATTRAEVQIECATDRPHHELVEVRSAGGRLLGRTTSAGRARGALARVSPGAHPLVRSLTRQLEAYGAGAARRGSRSAGHRGRGRRGHARARRRAPLRRRRRRDRAPSRASPCLAVTHDLRPAVRRGERRRRRPDARRRAAARPGGARSSAAGGSSSTRPPTTSPRAPSTRSTAASSSPTTASSIRSSGTPAPSGRAT